MAGCKGELADAGTSPAAHHFSRRSAVGSVSLCLSQGRETGGADGGPLGEKSYVHLTVVAGRAPDERGLGCHGHPHSLVNRHATVSPRSADAHGCPTRLAGQGFGGHSSARHENVRRIAPCGRGGREVGPMPIRRLDANSRAHEVGVRDLPRQIARTSRRGQRGISSAT